MTIIKNLPSSYHVHKSKQSDCSSDVELTDKSKGGHWLLRSVSENNRLSLKDPSERLYALSKQHGFDYEVFLSNTRINIDRDSYFNSLSYLFVIPSGSKCSVKSSDFCNFTVINLDDNGILATYQKHKPGLHIHKHSTLKLHHDLSDHDKLLLIMVCLLVSCVI